MAIVRDLSGNATNAMRSGSVDQPFCSYNRTNAGTPNGTLTPQFDAEIILDTTNNRLWKAVGIANNSWVALTPT